MQFTGAPMPLHPFELKKNSYLDSEIMFLADYGTGAVMAVPCWRSKRSWDFAKEFNSRNSRNI